MIVSEGVREMPAAHPPEFRRRALDLVAQGNPVGQTARDRDMINKENPSRKAGQAPIAEEALEVAYPTQPPGGTRQKLLSAGAYSGITRSAPSRSPTSSVATGSPDSSPSSTSKLGAICSSPLAATRRPPELFALYGCAETCTSTFATSYWLTLSGVA